VAEFWNPTGQTATPASVQHGNGNLEADADNYAAMAAYRLSAKAGNPLSERKLAQMFGRTSAAGRAPGSPKRGHHHQTE
jgi:hypothetical protein